MCEDLGWKDRQDMQDYAMALAIEAFDQQRAELEDALIHAQIDLAEQEAQ